MLPTDESPGRPDQPGFANTSGNLPESRKTEEQNGSLYPDRSTALSGWGTGALHTDFAARVEWQPGDTWYQTRSSGVTLQPVEVVDVGTDDGPRITALMRFEPNSFFHLEHHIGGTEILILEGSLCDDQQVYAPGSYLRIPVGHTDQPRSDTGCLAFIKLGQIEGSDAERRVIDINADPTAWLPGPVDGVEVLPLHGHGNKSMFMIRWNTAAMFKPGLDPHGEELLVVSGRVHDENGSYGQYTWLRNPIPAWQAWSGDAGTLVYYKHGHFPAHLC